ncbi:SIMPL domain-containing protein [Streptomyces sp. S3(2020)]|uniref:SIMPL domain-containing protein n=1 Tax=Streptomyces sp. S3(2020) TaxID=2732044 RepID=UPI001487D3F8|nr:SIMPL domain-containing protein [Streptomyces sp. S3(2020)]NNN32958.1 SIMPL domain-containing protein [Streptomyces sp. S3(2020)]
MPVPRTTVTAIAVVLLALGLPVAAAPGAAATGGAVPAVRVAAAPATVTVTGEGSAAGEPDIALVGAGVEATAKTTRAALDAQNEAAAALLRAVRAQGIVDRDIRTENVSVSPVYDYQDGVSTLKGYRAAQSFSIRVREVATAGALITAVTEATGDAGRVDSVVFDLDDRRPLQARAREAAYQDAHAKAAQYAELGGHRLGRLVSLSEGGTGYVLPMPPVSGDVPGAGIGAVPLAPGEIRATASVTAVYELD